MGIFREQQVIYFSWKVAYAKGTNTLCREAGVTLRGFFKRFITERAQVGDRGGAEGEGEAGSCQAGSPTWG